ncbi:MAG: TIGR02270 family protein [Myxococcales bacterium]|nr:TIGR02270 family protein [Myxococcales bacterium]
MIDAASEPLWDIVEEHLDEAEFLWEQWEASLVAPNYVLSEVEEGPEARLLAHVDGLVVNGPRVVERLLLPTLADVDAEPTRVRAAALALLHAPGEAGLAAVLAGLRELPPQRPELARALECCDSGPLAARLGPLLADEDADLRYTAARVLAYHGEALPDVARAIFGGAGPGRTVERVLGLRVVPRLTEGLRFRKDVLAALASDDPELRDAGMTSGALLDLPQAWGVARELAAAGDADAGRALLLLALRGEPADRPLLAAAVDGAALRRSALWALGFLGTGEAVELAVPWLEDGACARLAGEVVAAVTGVNLEDEHLTAVAPEDEALVHRPEDDLPLPDAMAVLKWWRRRRGDFAGEQRRVDGRPRDADALRAALREGPMRRRAAHLLGLQLGCPPGRGPALEPTAPGRRQRRELAAL